MNFFEQQAKARSNSSRLVLLFSLAIISLIVITQLFVLLAFSWSKGIFVIDQNSFHYAMMVLGKKTFFLIAAAIVGIVALAWLYKSAQLASGGKAIAEALDGRLINHSTRDLDEKKILNVVEEMAIASGIAVPPVYILEQDGINAFAAGYTTKDAIIGITRGSIRSLDRDELQGVIAHEFSHIFNGDMRLNIKLISMLNGILVIGMIGQVIMRSTSDDNGYSSNRSRNGVPFLIFVGAGLYVIGYTGTFFGNLIKAAVSRQREFLADASAVQFTRNPEGISNALKKIGGFALGSYIQSPETDEFSHLFFNQAINIRFAGMMATHPPLNERIKRIEPHWQGEFIKVAVPYTNPYLPKASRKGNTSDADTFVTTAPAALLEPIAFIQSSKIMGTTAAAAIPNPLLNTSLESAGKLTRAHVSEAQQLLKDIPENLQNCAHDMYDVQALIYCLLLDKKRADIHEKQLQDLQNNLPADIYQGVLRIKDSVAVLPPRHRLPLLDMSIAALKQLSKDQYQSFKKNLLLLINADNTVDLMEWSLYRTLVDHIEHKTRSSLNNFSLVALQEDCQRLLSAVAVENTKNIDDARMQFNKGWAIIGLPDRALIEDCLSDIGKLDRSLKRAANIHPLKKPQLIKACCATLKDSTHPESIELIRTIANSLDVPLPPLLNGQSLC